MKIIILMFISCSVYLLSSAKAQTPDHDALKKVVESETIAYYKFDSTGIANSWIQNEHSRWTFIFNGYYTNKQGWKDISRWIFDGIKAEGGKPSRYSKLAQTNFVINASGDLATLIYDQIVSVPDNDTVPVFSSREYRTMIKFGKDWKISSAVSIDTLSFSSTRPMDVEGMFNATGYNFMKESKFTEAIKIFEFNVTMFPKSSNTYDSLGEAYAASGNKTLAITNYEKSIQLNPKNENGKLRLKKLKQ